MDGTGIFAAGLSYSVRTEALTLFLPLFCIPVFHDENKTREKGNIISLVISLFPSTRVRTNREKGLRLVVAAERLQIATRNFRRVRYCYSYYDKSRRSSEKVDQQQFPERDFLRTRWTVPIDGATLVLHGWFLNALCFAAARPTNVPAHKEHARQ